MGRLRARARGVWLERALVLALVGVAGTAWSAPEDEQPWPGEQRAAPGVEATQPPSGEETPAPSAEPAPLGEEAQPRAAEETPAAPSEKTQPAPPAPRYVAAARAAPYEPLRAGHPLRIIAYALHPIGVILDYAIFRPAYWIGSHEPIKTLVGQEED